MPPGSSATSPAFLVVLSGPHFGQILELAADRELVLGTAQDADLRFLGDGVAPRHVALLLSGSELRLSDLESPAGTFVGGARVSASVLHEGERFQLGPHTVLKFVGSGDAEGAYHRALAQGALNEPLTGLYNRRYFLERLRSELAASLRHGRALSLLLLDVDRLHDVNGARGLLGGDEALKMVAHVLLGAVRREDVVARVGGEEFAVLARETGLSGARALAERVRKAVERSRSSLQGAEIAVTVSVGVTVSTGVTQFEPGRTEDLMLAAAERSLLRAKQNGRNTVVAAPAL